MGGVGGCPTLIRVVADGRWETGEAIPHHDLKQLHNEPGGGRWKVEDERREATLVLNIFTPSHTPWFKFIHPSHVWRKLMGALEPSRVASSPGGDGATGAGRWGTVGGHPIGFLLVFSFFNPAHEPAGGRWKMGCRGGHSIGSTRWYLIYSMP